MNQDQANQKYKEWGVLILLDSPEHIELGIDNTVWKIGHKFKGVKLIPPGPHIVYYSLKQEKYMFKISFFINITPENRVIVKKWNEKFEDFVSVDQTEKESYEKGVNDFSLDQYLGAYPYERFEIWKEISGFISQDILDKLNPIEKKMYIEEQEYKEQQLSEQLEKERTQEIVKNLYGEDFGDMENDPEEMDEEKIIEEFAKQMDSQCNIDDEEGNERNSKNPKKEQQKEQKKNPQKNNKKQQVQQEFEEKQKQVQKQQEEFKEKCEKEDFSAMAGTIYYTEIPKRNVQHGITGRDLTEANLDKSAIFKQILKKSFKEDYKLFFGEFQYAFSSFLLGENYDSFEQWKDMLVILTNCDKYLEENQQFGIDLIPVLYGILKQFPKDFFIDNISKDNFLKKCLVDFLRVCEEEKSKKLRERAKKLRKMLEDQFLFFGSSEIVVNEQGQYIFDMDEEDAPTIVDTNFIKL